MKRPKGAPKKRVAPAKQPAKQSAPMQLALTGDQLAALVGTCSDSEDTRKVLPIIATTRDLETFTSTAPDFECRPFDDDSWHFDYPAHGLSMFITSYNTITELTAYGPGDKRFATYLGTLPEGLAWTASRAEVDAKLKGVQAREDRSTIRYWRRATERRYMISYRRGRMNRLRIRGFPR